MTKQKMTLEKLALITKKGFDGVDEKFKNIDEKFKNIDEKFKNIDENFKNIDKNFKNIDEKFKNTDEKINTLPDKEFVENAVNSGVAEIRKSLVVIVKKENKKMDALIEILKKKKILNKNDLSLLSKIVVFPKIEIKS